MKFKRLVTRDEVTDLIYRHNNESSFVCIDTETTSKKPREAVLLDVQLSGFEDEEAFVFSEEFADELLRLDSKLTLVAHHYAYDAHVLDRHGIGLLDRKWRDTLLLGHLLDENRPSYSLDSYVKELWNDDYKEKFWQKNRSYQEASEEDKVDYGCRDVVYTARLYNEITGLLRVREGIDDSLITHVHRLQAALLRTEIEGVRVDLDYITELGAKLLVRLNNLEPKMRSLVKNETEIVELKLWEKAIAKYKSDKGRAACQKPTFSFESSQQLSTLLYDVLGLPVQRNEKTKAISTDFSSLERIKTAHPVVELIQENRELQKIYGTYIEGTLDKVGYDREHAARVYPQFRVAGTVTGRLSHNSPNLAQLPKSGGVRGIYVPTRGRKLISADYSQLEVVVEANLTGDKNLIRMLENGESKHDLTSRELGCSRDTAKTLNFALQYWASHFKIAKLLDCPIDEAQGVYRKYWEVYSGSRKLKAWTDKQVDEGIPLRTMFGRKRRFRPGKRSAWDSDYRQAYNFLIQSTGSDFTSQAFYLTSEALLDRGIGKALFSVHDELVVEAYEDHVEEVEKIVLETMVGVGEDMGLKVPLKAVSSGPMDRWED